MKNLLFFIIFSFILSSCVHHESSVMIQDSNLLNETTLQESLGQDFNEIFNLLSDDGIKAISTNAKVVEVNGYRILYSNSDEIFILKDGNVLARINGSSRLFYDSDAAPLLGQRVLLKDNFIEYNNNVNSFLDYGIDGLDVIEENDFKFLRENQKKTLQPNSSFVNGEKCTNAIEGISRLACCGKIGYYFSWTNGWTVNEKLTQKCQYISKGLK
ncbi:hypothetical protein LVJ85_10665 [Neisseria sp. Dent CA1/247]|uniref:hypothetical protein n=1 Tax=Neisseria sp. Dent CA1/247 TaxID=2912675 RepID=UPI001FD299C4|nr:hypothetical protein [Neisseria sp. Dent CA1/247]UOO76463.1 hypothetical protein LVJ85_10665 [Neisseria sp. Dent CA1/247]